ncbi:unnamed protein product [Mortierella alpina]
MTLRGTTRRRRVRAPIKALGSPLPLFFIDHHISFLHNIKHHKLFNMTKPTTTTTNYNTTTTTTTKPSTMETIKDKAATLVDKVTGKHHDGAHHTSHTTHTTDVHNPNAPRNHAGPLHTGAAAADTAVPHGASVDRAAYQQQQQPGAPANSIPVTGQQHHGLNAANVDPNHVHPSVIPHGTTTTTTTSATGTHIPAGGHHNVQHPAPAGPTGTTNVPTYAQNIPPTAAGVVPTAFTAEQVHDPNHHNNQAKQDHHHTGGLGGLLNRHHDDHHHQKNVAGTTGHDTGVHVAGGVPVNTNNSTMPVNQSNLHQAAPVHTDNNTVPAMGAPGTTTAAGTHMPGGFNNNNNNTATATYQDQHHQQQQQYGHDGSIVGPPVPNKNTPAPVL